MGPPMRRIKRDAGMKFFEKDSWERFSFISILSESQINQRHKSFA